MEPIVYGLEEEYGRQVDFIALNAADGAVGEQAFADYGLRGHPTIVIVQPDGEISWMGPGVFSREMVEQEVLAVLD